MKIYTLHKKQNLPITKEKAWEFLSSPKNLKTITQDYMGFNILSGADRPMFSGDRKSTRLNSSHGYTSYAVICLKKKNK